MPVTIIVGGQFGSEGKGKVAHAWAEGSGARFAVRVGGSNSGHTAIVAGEPVVLRHLPTPVLLPHAPVAVLPPGNYIDLPVLLREIEMLSLGPDRLAIDPLASVVQEEDRAEEQGAGLRDRVGSTLSGTGAAVGRRVRRESAACLAHEEPALKPYLRPTAPLLRAALDEGERVVVEGTQGFGLSLLHNVDYPYATSRDTSAAACLAESGLSPLDVDEVVLVIRAFPIRVGGNSGRLPKETSWPAIAAACGRERMEEFTTVTGRLRRVAEFDPEVVRAALITNRPTHVVLNHVDYVNGAEGAPPTLQALEFVRRVEGQLKRKVDFVGTGRAALFSPGPVHGTVRGLPDEQQRATSGDGREGAPSAIKI